MRCDECGRIFEDDEGESIDLETFICYECIIIREGRL
jgi:hypothetical protein